MEFNLENIKEVETLLQDENVLELLALLKQYKEHNLERGVYDTVNYVQNLENTLSMMMEQMTSMQQELLSMREQNNELISVVNHTVKDTVIENIQKTEQKVQELYVRLNEIRTNISNTAKEIVNSAKQLGKFAFIKMTDFLHIREGLDDIRQKAENAMKYLDTVKADVDRAKTVQVTANDTEKEMPEDVKEAVQSTEPLGTYQEEMQKFMEAKVAEGVHYKTNAEAFEEFKQYFDEKIKMSGVARQQAEATKFPTVETKIKK
jgi:ElaB/YqjD/DUF883 family membrane-anchored ribosome-binding protein